MNCETNSLFTLLLDYYYFFFNFSIIFFFFLFLDESQHCQAVAAPFPKKKTLQRTSTAPF